VQFNKVYISNDFIRYCKALEPEYSEDLMQEVAIAIYTLDEGQRIEIERNNYMLRYAQRTAFYIHVKWHRERQKNPITFTSPIVNYQKVGKDVDVRDEALHQIKKDLKDREYSIPAKMLLYSVEHGTIKEFAKASGIPYKTLQSIIKKYKNRIKQCVKK
jgi:DNA-directed RNA polymerase specialized sigma24 family protein